MPAPVEIDGESVVRYNGRRGRWSGAKALTQAPFVRVNNNAFFRALTALAIFALIWQMLSLAVSDLVAPGWRTIYESLLQLDYSYVAVTGLRVLAALLISFALGVAGAVLFSYSRLIESYLMPGVKILMAVPVVCWILFAVLWFANVEIRIAFVLIIVCGPVFLVDLLDAIKGIPKEQRDMVNAFRASRIQYYRKLVMQAVSPTVVTSWKINISLAIRVVTMAELVGAVSGIGYALSIAQQQFTIEKVFAWTLVLVSMLLVIEAVLALVEKRLLRWRD